MQIIGIEDTRNIPNTYGQLIFEKGTKLIIQGKESLFKKLCWTIDIHIDGGGVMES